MSKELYMSDDEILQQYTKTFLSEQNLINRMKRILIDSYYDLLNKKPYEFIEILFEKYKQFKLEKTNSEYKITYYLNDQYFIDNKDILLKVLDNMNFYINKEFEKFAEYDIIINYDNKLDKFYFTLVIKKKKVKKFLEAYCIFSYEDIDKLEKYFIDNILSKFIKEIINIVLNKDKETIEIKYNEFKKSIENINTNEDKLTAYYNFIRMFLLNYFIPNIPNNDFKIDSLLTKLAKRDSLLYNLEFVKYVGFEDYVFEESLINKIKEIVLLSSLRKSIDNIESL